MHFGKQLKLVMYQPWKEGYLDWKRLKCIIREIEARTRERAHNMGMDVRDGFQSVDTAASPTAEGSSTVLPAGYGSINSSSGHVSGIIPVVPPAGQTGTTTTTTTTTTAEDSPSTNTIFVPTVRRSVDEERVSLLDRGILLPTGASEPPSRSESTAGGDSVSPAAAPLSASVHPVPSPMASLSATSMKKLATTMEGVRKKQHKKLIFAELATQDEIDFFINELENERVRVEAFFMAQLQFARAKMEAAIRMTQHIAQSTSNIMSVRSTNVLIPVHEDKVIIKKALFDAMFTCEELVDFSRLNLVGFTKLVAKLVKYTNYSNPEDMLQRISQSAFVHGLVENDTLKDEIKQAWMMAFHGEEYAQYLAQQQQSKSGEQASPSLTPEQRSASALDSSGGSSRKSLRRGRKKSEEAPALPNDTELEDSVHAARAWKRNTILAEFDDHQRRVAVRSSTKIASEKPVWPYLLATLLLCVCQFCKFFPPENLPAQHCLGILAAATVLWVTEVCPLFLTALLIPLGVILCGVLVVPETDSSSAFSESATNVLPQILPAKLAVAEVFRQLFPTNIPLILAGFAIAQAFAKYGLDVAIVQFVLKYEYWRTPQRFLVALEAMCFVMSMFISNVAASVLMMTIAMPVIRDLPKHSVYAKTILLAIAVSGNVGGMTTLIASPQNSVCAGLGEYTVDFVHFSMISLPLCPILLTAGHILVVTLFRPDIKQLPKLSFANGPDGSAAGGDTDLNIELASDILAEAKKSPELLVNVPFWKRRVFQQAVVVLITLLSIVMWACSPWLDFFGNNIGVISLIPLALFFGSRLLGKDEFEKMPWPLVILIAGGNVLGYAVEKSHLLEMTAQLLLGLPANVWIICAVSGLIMMAAGSFVSHTVAALILLRLFAKVGEALGHAKLLVMTSIIMCSGAMPLPISSFPNLNTFSVENGEGVQYLSTLDFVKIGIPCTLLAYCGSISVTYGMSYIFGL